MIGMQQIYEKHYSLGFRVVDQNKAALLELSTLSSLATKDQVTNRLQTSGPPQA